MFTAAVDELDVHHLNIFVPHKHTEGVVALGVAMGSRARRTRQTRATAILSMRNAHSQPSKLYQG